MGVTHAAKRPSGRVTPILESCYANSGAMTAAARRMCWKGRKCTRDDCLFDHDTRQLPTRKIPCRHGRMCRMPWCHFMHPEGTWREDDAEEDKRQQGEKGKIASARARVRADRRKDDDDDDGFDVDELKEAIDRSLQCCDVDADDPPAPADAPVAWAAAGPTCDAATTKTTTTTIDVDELICPITFERLVDPVITSLGHTYERRAILDWFSTGSSSDPLTGEELPSLRLLDNLMVRNILSRV